jgi:beta-N-acetylhexosaminidase
MSPGSAGGASAPAGPVGTAELPLGSLMVDVAGTALSRAERDRLRHPAVGGVILFARNYESPAQLRALTAAIRAVRSPALLIAVDHEGGRVQRFRHGFTLLPAQRRIGAVFAQDPDRALALAQALGVVIGSELGAHGLDLSFAPVLDVDYGRSAVIGDRSFDADPNVVSLLGASLIRGLAAAGMGAVGKHFPGHGYAAADSHHAIPVDERSIDSLRAMDLAPYRAAIAAGLAGVMPAHVVYPVVDAQPAGFSPIWLQQVLRGELGFRGMIFSDDLTMEGASAAGDIVARAQAAFDAGCDMALVCNAPELAQRLIEQLPPRPLDPARVQAFRPVRAHASQTARGRYLEARRTLASL